VDLSDSYSFQALAVVFSSLEQWCSNCVPTFGGSATTFPL